MKLGSRRLATIEWITRQPWFGGSIALTGASYLGFVQWALGGELPPEVKAMISNNTESAFTLEFLRPDVLTYTTAPLPADTEIIGEVSAEIWFSSGLPSADVFVRLCDVDTRGRSWNVCDGLTRMLAASQSVFHDPARPSAVTLPVRKLCLQA